MQQSKELLFWWTSLPNVKERKTS